MTDGRALTERELRAVMEAEFERVSALPADERLEVSPAILRSMIVTTCMPDIYRTLKELFNAGFRGPDLVLS